MSVPNTTTFTLQDVVDEINPTTDDLVDCFADANSDLFDSTYEGSKNGLLNFRNYNAYFEGILYIVDIDYVQSSTDWSDIDDVSVTTTASDGYTNSLNIVNQGIDAGNPGLSGALYCLANNVNVGSEWYSDWFMPSQGSLNTLYTNKSVVNTEIIAQNGDPITSAQIWSSSQETRFNAFYKNFTSGALTSLSKASSKQVRAIRKQYVVDTTNYSVGDYAFGGVVFKLDSATTTNLVLFKRRVVVNGNPDFYFGVGNASASQTIVLRFTYQKGNTTNASIPTNPSGSVMTQNDTFDITVSGNAGLAWEGRPFGISGTIGTSSFISFRCVVISATVDSLPTSNSIIHSYYDGWDD
jgi:hypothetical protein